jgi:hypothetical protein
MISYELCSMALASVLLIGNSLADRHRQRAERVLVPCHPEVVHLLAVRRFLVYLTAGAAETNRAV